MRGSRAQLYKAHNSHGRAVSVYPSVRPSHSGNASQLMLYHAVFTIA